MRWRRNIERDDLVTETSKGPISVASAECCGAVCSAPKNEAAPKQILLGLVRQCASATASASLLGSFRLASVLGILRSRRVPAYATLSVPSLQAERGWQRGKGEGGGKAVESERERQAQA